MTFGVRFQIVALAAFAFANVLAAAFMPWLWRWQARGQGAALASALRNVRLMPFWLSAGAMAWASLAFLVFEPREQEETFGIVMTSVAVAAMGLVLLAAGRVVWALIHNWRLRRLWLEGAEPVTIEGLSIPAFAVSSSFPVVAVIGIVRPRLIIARSVLSACTPEELRAVMAHERGHIIHRDNLTRLWFAAAPDLVGWLPISRRIASAWQEASEHAADDCAGALGPSGRIALAEALIRVARLTPRGSLREAVPASALYRGENIEHRVRRLLSPPAVAVAPAMSIRRRVGTYAGIVVASLLTLHLIHEMVEAVVTFLP